MNKSELLFQRHHQSKTVSILALIHARPIEQKRLFGCRIPEYGWSLSTRETARHPPSPSKITLAGGCAGGVD